MGRGDANHFGIPKWENTCDICSKNSDGTTKFCSVDHYTAWYEFRTIHGPQPAKDRRERCLECGKVFLRCGKTTRFCSSRCYGKYNSDNPGELYIAPSKDKLDKVCKKCGEKFSVHPYRINAEFCSKTCFYTNNHDIRLCIICRSPFEVPKWKSQKCCSSGECKEKNKQNNKFYYNVSKGELDLYQTLVNLLPHRKVHNMSWVKDPEVGMMKPDIIIDGKYIIEYFGDMWHGSYSHFGKDKMIIMSGLSVEEKWEVDKKRDDALIRLGYKTIMVWENEYRNKRNTIEKIFYFLEENFDDKKDSVDEIYKPDYKYVRHNSKKEP